MIEEGLVYIHSTRPTRRFVGCGALVEGGYVATCRHVWRMATEGQVKVAPDQLLDVEIEYPRLRSGGVTIKSLAWLVDACEGEGHPPPDLVLLLPADIPSGVMTLQLARGERFEVGSGFALAGLTGRDPKKPNTPQDMRIDGTIADHRNADGLRQFTGSTVPSYWFERGSSGSPIFLRQGQQLAGILSLSERGANQGESPLHEAFVVPASTIRSYVIELLSRSVAQKQGIDPADLRPILDAIGASDISVADIPARLKQFVDAARARAAEPVRPTNDGADIEATIAASRAKLRALDTAGARDVLQAKIAEEEQTRTQRLVRLLRERAGIESLAFDYDAAKATLAEVTRLMPDDVWAWIELGDLWLKTGALARAAEAYRAAEAAARHTGDERDLSVSQNRIGDVLVAQGDRAGALAAYRAALAIAEALARRDPANTEWQRDLSVSQNKIGDVLVAQGDRAGALAAYRVGLAIREALARRDPANTEWQRDLSVSQDRIGDVLKRRATAPVRWRPIGPGWRSARRSPAATPPTPSGNATCR
jgi:tetratricopeptide (TPR) repeat protein